MDHNAREDTANCALSLHPRSRIPQRLEPAPAMPMDSELSGGLMERWQLDALRRSYEKAAQLVQAMQTYERERGKLRLVPLDLAIQSLEKQNRIAELLRKMAKSADAVSPSRRRATALLLLRRERDEILAELARAGLQDGDPGLEFMRAHLDEQILKLFDD